MKNRAKGFDVVTLPVSDWLGQDLQLQVLLLPHVLALGLEEQRGALGGNASTNAVPEVCASYRQALKGVHTGVQVGSVGVLVLR